MKLGRMHHKRQYEKTLIRIFLGFIRHDGAVEIQLYSNLFQICNICNIFGLAFALKVEIGITLAAKKWSKCFLCLLTSPSLFLWCCNARGLTSS